MPRIPEADIERLKDEVSMQRLVEASGVDLKRAGKDWLGCCPFHDDREASLVVTPAKNLWHCFGCQIGGGPIDWVMKSRGVSFRHAVELLKADAGLVACAVVDGESRTRRRRQRRKALGHRGMESPHRSPQRARPGRIAKRDRYGQRGSRN